MLTMQVLELATYMYNRLFLMVYRGSNDSAKE